MNDSQKQREILFFEQFKQLWADFPNNHEVEPDESPDFKLISTHHKVGVELTELTNEKKPNYDFPLTQIFTLEEQITEQAQKYFSENKNIHLTLGINFERNFKCKKNEINELAKEIARIVEFETSKFDLQNKKYFQIEYCLPEQINCIMVSYSPKNDDSVWYSPQGGIIPEISNKQIEALINKKSKFIPKYRMKVDSIYLLIVEGFIPISWFSEFKNWDKSKITTDFDKVFLLRSRKNKLYELT